MKHMLFFTITAISLIIFSCCSFQNDNIKYNENDIQEYIHNYIACNFRDENGNYMPPNQNIMTNKYAINILMSYGYSDNDDVKIFVYGNLIMLAKKYTECSEDINGYLFQRFLSNYVYILGDHISSLNPDFFDKKRSDQLLNKFIDAIDNNQSVKYYAFVVGNINLNNALKILEIKYKDKMKEQNDNCSILTRTLARLGNKYSIDKMCNYYNSKNKGEKYADRCYDFTELMNLAYVRQEKTIQKLIDLLNMPSEFPDSFDSTHNQIIRLLDDSVMVPVDLRKNSKTKIELINHYREWFHTQYNSNLIRSHSVLIDGRIVDNMPGQPISSSIRY